MTNAESIFLAELRLSSDFAKYARIKLYGLHYSNDFWSLYGRSLIIKALELNDFFDLYTDEEIECLIARLSNPRVSVGVSGCCGS